MTTDCIDCNGKGEFVTFVTTPQTGTVLVGTHPCHCAPRPTGEMAVVVEEPGAWQLIGDVDCAVGE